MLESHFSNDKGAELLVSRLKIMICCSEGGQEQLIHYNCSAADTLQRLVFGDFSFNYDHLSKS